MAHQLARASGALTPETARGVSRGLGWFSIGLGLVEVLAPRALARSLGMRGSEQLLQAYGLREIATGIGILASPHNPAPWLWGRVAGDGLDIATLLGGLSDDNPKRANVGLALAAVAGVTLLDIATAEALSHEDDAASREEAWRRLDVYRRSGMPQPAAQMRGAASDFAVPHDYKTPEALRPWA